MIRRFVQRNWKVVAILLLILAMLVLVPEETTRFIYTEF
jgi:hypothetical protein